MLARNRTSNLIHSQVPEFVRADHPVFIAFLEAYYEWMEQTGNVLHLSKNIPLIDDIDTTLDAFVEFFRKEYAVLIPSVLTAGVNKRILLKNLKDLYFSRGSEKSYELLFRIMFNSDSSMYYPNLDIARADDGKWIQNEVIRGYPIQGDILDLTYKKITGVSSGATASVEKVYKIVGDGYCFYEIYLIPKSTDGVFQVDEQIEAEGDILIQTYPMLTDITLVYAGDLYAVGDELTITDDTGQGAKARVKSLESVTSTVGGVDYGPVKYTEVYNPGVNYSAATLTTFEPKADTANGTAVIGTKFTYPGYYLNEDGQTDTTKYFADDYFYQQFSYVVKSDQSLDIYREIVKKLLHPAGLIMFGQVEIDNMVDAGAELMVDQFGEVIPNLILYLFTYNSITAEWFLDDDVVLADNETTLIIDATPDSDSYGLGPCLRDFDMRKFNFLPSYLFPGENAKWFAPNADYWATDAGYGLYYANTQLKDLGYFEVDDFTNNRLWVRINLCDEPYTQIFDVDAVEIEYEAIASLTLDLNPDDIYAYDDIGDYADDIVGGPDLVRDLLKAQVIEDVTPTLWLNAENGVTEADKSVSQWDSEVGSISFTQATAVNKPTLTRADNKENRIKDSADFTTANWNRTSDPVTVVGSLMTAVVGVERHGLFAVPTAPYSPAMIVRGRFDVEYGNNRYICVGGAGDTPWHLATFDFQTGTITETRNITATVEAISATRFVITTTFTCTAASGACPCVYLAQAGTNASPPFFDAAGTETVTIHTISEQSALADADYLATTSAPQLRGLNGRVAVHFDGQNDKMTSTDHLHDIFGDSAKTFFAVVRPAQVAAAAAVICESNDGWYFAAPSTGRLRVNNYDGNHDGITALAVVNTVYVVTHTHDGVNLTLNVNGVDVSPVVASGATTSAVMNGTLQLGFYSTQWFAGDLCEIIACDEVLDATKIATVQNYLNFKWRDVEPSVDFMAIGPSIGTVADFAGVDEDAAVFTRDNNEENLLFASEDFSDGSWTVSGGTISADSLVNPINALTDGDSFIESVDAATERKIVCSQLFVAGETYSISGFVQNLGRDYFTCLVQDTITASCWLRINTDTVSIQQGVGMENAELQQMITYGDWMWFQGEFEATNTATGTITFYQHEVSGSFSYDGDGSSGIGVWGFQVRKSKTDDTYVKSDLNIERAGVNSHKAIYADGTDVLNSTSVLSDIIAADASTLYAVFETDDIQQVNGVIIRDSNSKWMLEVDSGYLVFTLDGVPASPSASPSTSPSSSPSTSPSASVSSSPSASPSSSSSASPSASASGSPSASPSASESSSPSASESSSPSASPSASESGSPSASESSSPSTSPSASESSSPSASESSSPSASPSSSPSESPSTSPSSSSSASESSSPSASASGSPSSSPSESPSTSPSASESSSPSASASASESSSPSASESSSPSSSPSGTESPSASPSASASASESSSPSASASGSPSASASSSPSASASGSASASPSASASTSPSASESSSPSASPSTSPSASPSTSPSASPSTSPSASASGSPSATPSTSPSASPSTSPSASPSTSPSASASASPSATPSSSPSASPSLSLSGQILSLPILPSTKYIARIQHKNDMIYMSLNGGADIQAPVDDVTHLTGTLKVGDGFIGKIGRIIVANTALDYDDQKTVYLMLLNNYGLDICY